MSILSISICILIYFLILSIFRIFFLFVLFKCIINIKLKITNNLKEKMEGLKKWNVSFVVENLLG
jgi:hypothetical protein